MAKRKGPLTFGDFVEDVKSALVKDGSLREDQAAWVVAQEQVRQMMTMSVNFGTGAKETAKVVLFTLAASLIDHNMKAAKDKSEAPPADKGD